MAATNTLTNLAAQATDIRDIRPLVEIPNHWIWLWVFLALLALVALILWIVKIMQKRRAETLAVPEVPAHILARQRLDESLSLIHQPKPFIITVSDTLRAYLEGAFDLRAPEQTTEEFLVALQHSALLSAAQKTSLGDFLQSCDLVKFAKYEPQETELRELHSYALELVTQTEPVPASPQNTETDGNQPGNLSENESARSTES